jgi:hypothetical protein
MARALVVVVDEHERQLPIPAGRVEEDTPICGRSGVARQTEGMVERSLNPLDRDGGLRNELVGSLHQLLRDGGLMDELVGVGSRSSRRRGRTGRHGSLGKERALHHQLTTNGMVRRGQMWKA